MFSVRKPLNKIPGVSPTLLPKKIVNVERNYISNLSYITEKKIYSQNGEDGVIESLVKILYQDPCGKKYVEFGVEDGKECNTRYLREEYGWTGLLMDGGYENQDINLKREFITMENIVSLFEKHGVDKHINLLSIDIDFNDFYVLKEILKQYTADIIVCEINTFSGDKVISYKKDGMWDLSTYYGATLESMTKLCNSFGYSLVYCENRGVNAFFVRKELVPSYFEHVDDISFLKKEPQYSHKRDRLNRKFITYEEAIKINPVQ